VRDKRPSRRSRRRTAARAALVLAAALAGAFALHAAAAYRLLATPTLRRIVNTSPQTTWIDWDEATSIWPGRVRIRNLRIRGSDRNVQWIFHLEEARFQYSLLELAARRFHVLDVSGRGLSFHLRKIRRPDDPHPTPVGVLPPILGFSDPPSMAAAAASGSPRNPWTIRVDGIAIERLSEIWVDMYRFQGSAALHGEFRLRPGRLARIGPAAIDFASGRVRLGDEPVIALDRSRIGCRIEEWDPRLVEGDAVWRNISGEVALSGGVERLAFLDYFLRSSPVPRVAGGAGRARIGVRIDRGTARGAVSVEARDLVVRTAASKLKGDAVFAVRIPTWNIDGGPLDLSGSRMTWTSVASEPDGSRDWWCRLAVPSGTFGKLLDARLVLEGRDAKPILSVLGASIPKLARSLLTLEGLHLSARVRAARGRIEAREIDATGGSLHVRGEFRQAGHRQDGVFLLDAGKVNVGVKVRAGRLSLRPIATASWFERERQAIDGSQAAAVAASSSATRVREAKAP
jgi:hypothetical protein